MRLRTVAGVPGMTDPREHAITVLVADRHRLVRGALTRLLEREPGFAIAGNAGDLDRTRHLLGERRPQALLLEPAVLGDQGLQGIPGLVRCSPGTRVVLLADEDSLTLERRALDHGAAASILKHAHPDELFAAVRFAVHGGDLGAAALHSI